MNPGNFDVESSDRAGELHDQVTIFESRTGQMVLMDAVHKSDEEWKQQLTPEQVRCDETERHRTALHRPISQPP